MFVQTITGDRMQGLSLAVHSEAGDIKFKAVYADEANFTSQTGNVFLKSCHRITNVNITQQGNLEIGEKVCY